MKPAGKFQRFIEHPVHPVSNFEIFLVRFDMYVTGPTFHRFGEQHVYQANHGRLTGRIQQVLHLPQFFQYLRTFRPVIQVFHKPAGGCFVLMHQSMNDLQNLAARTELHINPVTSQIVSQIIGRQYIARIRGGHTQDTIVYGKWSQQISFQIAQRNPGDMRAIQRCFQFRKIVVPQRIGDKQQQLLFIQNPPAHQLLHQTPFTLQHLIEPFFVDGRCAEQSFPKDRAEKCGRDHIGGRLLMIGGVVFGVLFRHWVFGSTIYSGVPAGVSAFSDPDESVPAGSNSGDSSPSSPAPWPRRDFWRIWASLISRSFFL